MGRIWIDNFFYCLALTYASGLIMFSVFRMLRNRMERHGLFLLCFRMVKIVLASYMLPVAYVALYAYMIHNDLPGNGLAPSMGYSAVLGLTPAIYYGTRVLLMAWLVFNSINIFRYGKMLMGHARLLKSAVPCNGHIEGIFRDACHSMKIRKNIKIRHSRNVRSPGLTGIVRPVILLPLEEYSDKELAIIACHELTHYIQRDVIWRHIVLAISCIYAINRKHNRLYQFLDEYSELSCDSSVIEKNGISLQEYYTTIAGLGFHSAEKKEFLPNLYENKNSLERRAIKMVKFRKNRSRRGVAAFTLLFVLCSSLLFGMTGSAGAKVYSDVYERTYSEQLEGMDSMEVGEYEEYSEPAENFLYLDEEVVEINPNQRGTGNINWGIASGSSVRTSYFYKGKGSTITIMVSVTPTSNTVKAGIIEPDGNRRYVNSSGGLVSYTFTVNKSGDHAVYIQNAGSSKVTVTGVYVN